MMMVLVFHIVPNSAEKEVTNKETMTLKEKLVEIYQKEER